MMLSAYILTTTTLGLNNGLGLTPQLGYSSWNDCGSTPNASWIKRTARYFLSSGLADLGWRRINVDEGWMLGRSATPPHAPIEDLSLFPGGMKVLGSWIRAQNLSYGLYSSRGKTQCARPEYKARCIHTPPNPSSGCEGSFNHSHVDAAWMVAAGADYVKLDSCSGSQDHATAFAEYRKFRNALNVTGKPVFFSLCGWEEWYAPPDPSIGFGGGATLGNSYRIHGDGKDWGALSDAVNTIALIGNYSKPGAWADPDLLIGPWCGIDHDMKFCGQTDRQARTQFSLWSLFPAPLLISQNVFVWSDYAKETYMNAEAIAVNQQEKFVAPASRIVGNDLKFPCTSTARSILNASVVAACSNVWSRPLSDGAFALVFVNNANISGKVVCDAACFKAAWLHATELGAARGGAAIAAAHASASTLSVHDLWSHGSLPPLTAPFHLELDVEGGGGSRYVKLVPATSSSCKDVPPDGGYSCAQQKAWGKCNSAQNPWMVGYCCSTCFHCTAGCGAAPPPPPPPPAPGPSGASRFEAEFGVLNGATTAVATAIKGYSGTGYVTGFESAACNVAITFTVPSDGLYDLTIGYHVAAGSGDKGFEIIVNGAAALDGTFTNTGAAWGTVSAGKFNLKKNKEKEGEANNNATILNGWGYFEVDYIDVTASSVDPPKPPPKTLCDPEATPSAHKLMSFLVDTFGKKVLSGTQVRGPSLSAVTFAQNASGKQPALLEAGLLDYSPSFVARAGNVTNGFVEAAGKWAQGGNGLLAMCWHWNSPCDLMDTTAHPDKAHPWYQAFYTKNTRFNLSYALVNPTSPQYTKMISDLDVIAIQLTKLAALDLPVIWRPLHEASGGWFWWGAHGPDCFKALWTIMFDRFTQMHGLHNLIWVYTADPAHSEWYPGDTMVDVVGADIYEPTGSTMDSTWESFKAAYEGKKLITLSETGALIVPDAVRTYKTFWSWFNSWDITSYNITSDDVKTVYNDPDVLTLEELPDWRK